MTRATPATSIGPGIWRRTTTPMSVAAAGGDGVIRGRSLDVDPAALGLPIGVYIRIRPNPGQLGRVAELARSIPEVVECHRITGEDCFIVKAWIPAVGQLDRILDQFLLYGTTTSSIIQSSPV